MTFLLHNSYLHSSVLEPSYGVDHKQHTVCGSVFMVSDPPRSTNMNEAPTAAHCRKTQHQMCVDVQLCRHLLNPVNCGSLQLSAALQTNFPPSLYSSESLAVCLGLHPGHHLWVSPQPASLHLSISISL